MNGARRSEVAAAKSMLIVTDGSTAGDNCTGANDWPAIYFMGRYVTNPNL